MDLTWEVAIHPALNEVVQLEPKSFWHKVAKFNKDFDNNQTNGLAIDCDLSGMLFKHMKSVNFWKGQVTSSYLSPSVESYSSRAGNLRDTSQAPKIGTSRSTPMADLARESLDQHPARTTSNIPRFRWEIRFPGTFPYMYNPVLYASYWNESRLMEKNVKTDNERSPKASLRKRLKSFEWRYHL